MAFEWLDTTFATTERGCRDSTGNWRNMERREGQTERHEGFFLMGSTAGLEGSDGIVTTDICVHQGDDYYMVEWGDGVTSSSEMSHENGNRIVEVYTNEMIYRVYDIKGSFFYSEVRQNSMIKVIMKILVGSS